jgi:putative effector of murein hydrolase
MISRKFRKFKVGKKLNMRNLITGVVIGLLLGFVSHLFFMDSFVLGEVITSSFVLSSVVTGIGCAVVSNFLQWDFGILLGSVVIGIMVFFVEFLITGVYIDPLFRGAAHGLIFGAVFSFYIIIERRKLFKKEAQSFD